MSRLRLGTGSLARRQLRADWLPALTVVLLVGLTTAVFSALPRGLEGRNTAAAREVVQRLEPGQRSLVATTGTQLATVLPPGQDPLAVFQQVGDSIRDSSPVLLRRQLRDPVARLRTSRVTTLDGFRGPYVVLDSTGAPRRDPAVGLAFQAQHGWEQRVRVVTGEIPLGAEVIEELVEVDSEGTASTVEEPPEVQPVAVIVEGALTVQAASVLGLDVGDVVDLGVQSPAGDLAETRPFVPLSMRVTGLVEALAPEDDYWYLAEEFLAPQRSVTRGVADTRIGTAMLAPAGYRALTQVADPLLRTQVQVQVPVTGDGLYANEVRALASQLRVATSESTPVAGTSDLTLLTLSPLPGILQEHLDQRVTSSAIVALSGTSLYAVGLGVLLLAGRMVIERRQRPLAMAMARGASPRQLAVVLASEGVLLGVPAATAGYSLSTLVPGRPSNVAVLLAVMIGLSPAVLFVCLLRTRGGPSREDRSMPGTGSALRRARRDAVLGIGHRTRAVAELLVLALAATSLVLLRRRGLTTDAGQIGTDPLLAAVPLLVGLSAGVVAMRLYPAAVTVVARLTARRTAAVPFLAAARSAREGPAGAAAVLVLVLSLATTVFGLVVSTTVTAGIRSAAWQEVGADVRASSLGYTDEETSRVADVPGVASYAPVSVEDATVGRRETPVTLVATDPTGLTDVQGDVPQAPVWPDAAPNPTGPQLPAMAAAGVGDVGDELAVDIRSRSVTVEIVAVAETLPGLAQEGWLLVPLDQLRQQSGLTLAPRDVLIKVYDEEPFDRAALLDALEGTSAVRTPGGVADATAQSPLVAMTLGLLPITVLLGGGYCVLALALALLISARTRHALLSQLQTLGFSRHQARRLSALELVPLTIVSTVTGALVGVAIPRLVHPAVQLQPLTGGSTAPALVTDIPAILALVGLFLVVLALALMGSVAISQRLRLGGVLRLGDET